jgi:hypothetical protein
MFTYSSTWLFAFLFIASLATLVGYQRTQLRAQSPAGATQLGLNVNEPGAFAGYTLVAPLRSTKTYLVDTEGRVVREWQSRYAAGQDAYLLENGHLLRAAHMSDDEILFAGASQGGRIQEFTWDGELVWDFKFHDDKYLRHHAITRMPSGNIMMIVWERKTAEECIAAGVNPDFVQGDILVDCLIEVQPQGKIGGKIVWEWHIWDHLIQDHDETKANYGEVAAHPELIDANYARSRGGFFGNFARAFRRDGDDRESDEEDDPEAEKEATDDAVQRLQGLGYVGTARGRRGPRVPISDWNHVNAVSYNAKLDQIMISPREFNEVWIIDHSTTTAEAASHRGGRSGKGGDLLYRWGNPEAYRAGTKADQQLFSQHDAHWIPEGLPGAGHMLVFNNGGGRPEGNHSSVDEVVLPVDEHGNYGRDNGKAFGPDAPYWSYVAEEPADFFAPLMSGAQRLPNGNTLICTGFSGEIFEVTPTKEVVWKLIVPDDGSGSGPNFGFPGPGRRAGAPNFGPPGLGRNGNTQPSTSVSLLPGPLRFMLELDAEQVDQLEDLERDFSAELEKLLTAEQLEEFDKIRSGQLPFMPPAEGKLAEVLPKQLQEQIKLTDEQQSSLSILQASLDEKLSKIVTDDQKERLSALMERAQQFFGGGPNAGPPGGGPAPNFGPPGRGRRGRGFPGAFGFGGTPGAAGVFRAYRYGVDYPGLAGRDLIPGKPFVEAVK